MENFNNPIIIDNGSGMIKAGFGGEEAPKVCFPSVVGNPKFENIHGCDNKEFYVGLVALKEKKVLDLNYPIKHGIIEDWDLMRKIWSHTYFSELRCEPSEHPVFLTQIPNNPKQKKEEMVKIFFEQFAAPSLYMYAQGTLALYASGLTTGIVIDAGFGKIDSVIVYENFNIKHAIDTMKIGGNNLNEILNNQILKKYPNIKDLDDDSINYIKEKLCYLPLDFEEEIKNYNGDFKNNVEYELPDGSNISLGKELIEIPEIIFQPQLIDLKIKNLNNIIYESIQKTEIEMRKKLYSNVVLAGGTSLLKGFQERISKEIHSMAPSLVNVKVNAPAERKYSVWIGSSILSTLSQFQTSWITKSEYEEGGVSIVHRKCL